VELSQGFVNVPPYRGSTVLFPNVHALETLSTRYTYGTHETPTTEMLTRAWSELSGAAGTVLTPSGLSAAVVALQTAVSAGDHLLVVDTTYSPTRSYCERTLRRFGVDTTYYDPALGADVAELFRPNTKAILLESPGSQSLEVQDVPAIAAAAHARGICVILDNTWATPILFSPHAHGVDLCVEAGTKYLGGHSDLLLGLVSANDAWFKRLMLCWDGMAILPGPEDVYLALRGLRTLELRLRETGSKRVTKCSAFSIPPCPNIPGTPSGGAIFPAPPGSLASCSNRWANRRSPRCSTAWSFSALAGLGAAMKVSSFPSIANLTGRRRPGRPADRL
jgi:cystathionine beta-lyase